jgi:Spy/CpxP family protein refolding chaperone
MKKTVMMACVFALMISVTGYAKMHGHGFGGGDRLPPGKWWHVPEVSKALNLTDEEKTRLDTLFLEKRKAMIAIKGEMATKHLDLEAIMEQAEFDETVALEKFEAIQKTGQNMWKNRFQFLIEVRKLLGKDRFIQLKTTFHRFHGHGKGKMRRGFPQGPPSDDFSDDDRPQRGKRWGWGH